MSGTAQAHSTRSRFNSLFKFEFEFGLLGPRRVGGARPTGMARARSERHPAIEVRILEEPLALTI